MLLMVEVAVFKTYTQQSLLSLYLVSTSLGGLAILAVLGVISILM